MQAFGYSGVSLGLTVFLLLYHSSVHHLQTIAFLAALVPFLCPNLTIQIFSTLEVEKCFISFSMQSWFCAKIMICFVVHIFPNTKLLNHPGSNAQVRQIHTHFSLFQVLRSMPCFNFLYIHPHKNAHDSTLFHEITSISSQLNSKNSGIACSFWGTCTNGKSSSAFGALSLQNRNISLAQWFTPKSINYVFVPFSGIQLSFNHSRSLRFDSKKGLKTLSSMILDYLRETEIGENSTLERGGANTAKKTFPTACMIKPRFYAQSLCRLHSYCAKLYTYANMWSLDGSLAGACCISTAGKGLGQSKLFWETKSCILRPMEKPTEKHNGESQRERKQVSRRGAVQRTNPRGRSFDDTGEWEKFLCDLIGSEVGGPQIEYLFNLNFEIDNNSIFNLEYITTPLLYTSCVVRPPTLHQEMGIKAPQCDQGISPFLARSTPSMVGNDIYLFVVSFSGLISNFWERINQPDKINQFCLHSMFFLIITKKFRYSQKKKRKFCQYHPIVNSSKSKGESRFIMWFWFSSICKNMISTFEKHELWHSTSCAGNFPLVMETALLTALYKIYSKFLGHNIEILNPKLYIQDTALIRKARRFCYEYSVYIVVFHLRYNAKSTLHRYFDSIGKVILLQEEEVIIWEKAMTREESYYIGKAALVLQEEEVYHGYSVQGIAEGSMCGARMVWYYYLLQRWRSRRRGQ
ncbi:putative signal peptide protein [Puccinia sorghi]|uniref:Putative signal peptide protein n=1 Tax=Puccinia sorghi TaxID=27349 RepID=A0A0L6V1Y0_9BASI|nr:putative signal peptide protein [Puccinia sorghi]